MENKRIELSNEALDAVVGGIQICSTKVRNEHTGQEYRLLVDKWAAFGYVSNLGDVPEEEKINALLNAGMIEPF